MFDHTPLSSSRLIAADGTRLSPSAFALLFLLCLAFFLPGIAVLPPIDRDEPLFAQASKQMIESGDYLDIHFQDQTRYRKPIGIYWLQALSASVLTPDSHSQIWAYRVPSVAGATLAVLMTAALGALLFGPAAGLLAALMLMSCVVLNADARLAKTDSMLLGMIMVAQYALARAYFAAEKNIKIAWGTWLAFWGSLAAGFLLKGPVVLLAAGSTLLWLRLADKKIAWMARLRPRSGIAFFLLLVLPWFALIALKSNGEFLRQSAGQDMLAKIWQGGQNHRTLMPGLHAAVFPLMAFPFSLWALLGLPDAWKNRAQPGVKFCLGWLIPTWILFELSLTKLPHYTIPAYPALALLAAQALLSGFPALAAPRWRWLPPLAISLWLMCGTGLAMGLVLAPYLLDHAWNIWQIGGGVALMIAQAASLFLLMQRRAQCVPVMAAGVLAPMMIAFAITFPALDHLWLTRDALRLAESAKLCPRAEIISLGYNEPSLPFLAGTKTQMWPGSRTYIVVEALQQNPCLIALVNAKEEPGFLAGFTGIAPRAAGSVEGYNLGNGLTTKLTLYVAPGKAMP